jgi:DNA polymerase III subunit delta
VPIIVLAGDEDFELSRRLNSLRKELLDPAWADLNLTVLRNPGPNEISDAAASLPFGPGNRVVLIDQCSLFTKSRKGKGSKGGKGDDGDDSKESAASSTNAGEAKELLKIFEQSLANVSRQTYLIFCCPYNFDSSLKYSKVAAQYAEVEEFPKPRYWPGSSNAALESWCRKEARLHGASINDEAISYLLEGTEADLRAMSAEIEKAALYILPETAITLEVVSRLSSHFSHAFSLLDHWAKGNRNLALNDVSELVSRRSGIPVIAMLNTSLTKWINIKSLSAARVAPSELAQQLNMKPFVLNLEMSRIKSLSLDYLVKKRIELTRLEALVKTGQMPDHHALSVFVAS